MYKNMANKLVDINRLARYHDNINVLLSTKQDTLISGTNIKTINGQSLMGEGDINIISGSGGTN